MSDERLVLPLSAVGVKDVGLVGGKNASLGEMIARLGSSGIRVPGGFATTATAYRRFPGASDHRCDCDAPW
jgi:pyruvate, water dikinase